MGVCMQEIYKLQMIYFLLVSVINFVVCSYTRYSKLALKVWKQLIIIMIIIHVYKAAYCTNVYCK